MNDIDLAVRCLQIEEEIGALAYQIKQTEAAIAFSDSDDDSVRREEVADARLKIAELQQEQAAMNARMVGQFPMEEAMIAHAALAQG